MVRLEGPLKIIYSNLSLSFFWKKNGLGEELSCLTIRKLVQEGLKTKFWDYQTCCIFMTLGSLRQIETWKGSAWYPSSGPVSFPQDTNIHLNLGLRTGFLQTSPFQLQSGEKSPSTESSRDHKAWPEPTCTDPILSLEKKNRWCFSCSTRLWEPGTKPSQFSAAQNKYGNYCAPWELAGQVYKSNLFQDKAGSRGAGQQLVWNNQERRDHIWMKWLPTRLTVMINIPLDILPCIPKSFPPH